jgi:hypothetical protein
LLFELVSELKQKNSFQITVSQMVIPAAAKPKILRDLDINRAALLPEVESAAKYIMSKLVPIEGGVEQEIAKRPRLLKKRA